MALNEKDQDLEQELEQARLYLQDLPEVRLPASLTAESLFERLDELEQNSVQSLPKASVQVAQPVGLSARLCEGRTCCCEPCCRIPDCICRRYGGSFCMENTDKVVYATIGIFTIVQIERNVQMMIPAYDFCIPEKECITSSDNPCELFSRIDFPTNEFFPPKVTDVYGDDHGCGCHKHKEC